MTTVNLIQTKPQAPRPALIGGVLRRDAGNPTTEQVLGFKKAFLATRRKEREQKRCDTVRAIRKNDRKLPLLPRDPEDIFSRMSFTAIRGDGEIGVRDFWVTPEPASYSEGNELGRKYADEFLAFSVDHPGRALLTAIVGDMDISDNSRMGIVVGFLYRIEQMAIKGTRA